MNYLNSLYDASESKLLMLCLLILAAEILYTLAGL